MTTATAAIHSRRHWLHNLTGVAGEKYSLSFPGFFQSHNYTFPDVIATKCIRNEKHCDSAYLRQGTSWLRGPAVEHRSLADVLSLSCARFVADG